MKSYKQSLWLYTIFINSFYDSYCFMNVLSNHKLNSNRKLEMETKFENFQNRRNQNFDET